MTAYQSMNVHQLRTAVRAAGLKGTGVLSASRAELLTYLENGVQPNGFSFSTIGELIAILGTADTYPVTEISDKYQERKNKSAGRPSVPVPADIEPLLKCFRNASEQGRPFSRTGKNGVYARRDELPTEWRNIGRDRLEKLVGDLIRSGDLHTFNNVLSACTHS